MFCRTPPPPPPPLLLLHQSQKTAAALLLIHIHIALMAPITKSTASRSLLVRRVCCLLAAFTAASVALLSRSMLSSAFASRRGHQHSFHTSTLHLAPNGSFIGGAECAFHFIWALSWPVDSRPPFSPALSPPPPHCKSFPASYAADPPLQARAIAKSHTSCLAILSLLVPLPPSPSLAAAAAYSCWHLSHFAGHFALMRRVAESAAPDGSRAPLPFNASVILQLLARAAPDAGHSAQCRPLAHRDKSLDLRCCLQDELCTNRHASQLTWVAAPQLLRTHAFTRYSALGAADVSEVGERKLLSVLSAAKVRVEGQVEHEVHKLWANYVTMSMLLPHSRRLRSAALDQALGHVTRGQPPGEEFAIFSEFSRFVSNSPCTL
jgi:hypothetical protein